MLIIQTVLVFKGLTSDNFETLNFWRMNITYFVVIFWLWNIIIWSNRDKKIGRFIALLFLPGLYTYSITDMF